MLLSVNVNHSSVGVAVDNRCERGVRVDLRLEVEVDKVHSGVECRGLTLALEAMECQKSAT